LLNRSEVERRIGSTNSAGLIAILYEALIDNFNDSIKAIEDNDRETLNFINNNSRDILAELISALKGDSEIARNLREIYIYLNKLITKAENFRNPDLYESAAKIVKPLYDGFIQLEESEDPKVVAGLTYGKNFVSEYNYKEGKTFKG